MTDAEKLPLFVRRGLWLVAVSAALTGFWLAPTAFIAAIDQSDIQHWSYAAFGLLLLAAGTTGWAWLVSDGRRRLDTHAFQALLVNFVVVALSVYPFLFVAINHRLCDPGDENGPAAIAWLAPAFAYYLIGYVGFTRKRWIRVLWPLAVAAGVLALLAVELIWKTGSGCGD
jgi:hypothetical protein